MECHGLDILININLLISQFKCKKNHKIQLWGKFFYEILFIFKRLYVDLKRWSFSIHFYIFILFLIYTHRINPNQLPMWFLSIFGISDMKFSNLSAILKVFKFSNLIDACGIRDLWSTANKAVLLILGQILPQSFSGESFWEITEHFLSFQNINKWKPSGYSDSYGVFKIWLTGYIM